MLVYLLPQNQILSFCFSSWDQKTGLFSLWFEARVFATGFPERQPRGWCDEELPCFLWPWNGQSCPCPEPDQQKSQPKAAPRPWIKTQATYSTFLAASTHLSCWSVSWAIPATEPGLWTQWHLVLVRTQQISVFTCFTFSLLHKEGGKGSQNLMLLIWRFPILFQWLHTLAWTLLDFPKTTLFPVYFQHLAKKNVQYEKNVCYPQLQRPFGKKYLEGF